MTENPEIKASRTLKLLQSDPNSINRSQLNSSTAKMQYSMPKARRFPKQKQDDNLSKFYDLPNTNNGRSTSLGYGKKMDLSIQYFQKPSPVQYNIKGQFDETNKKRGITISAGRQVIRNNSVFQISKNSLGPGQYEIRDDIFNDSKHKLGYSISSRNADLSNKWQKCIPGPGNYQTIELLDKNLRSSNSRVENVKSARFGKQKRASQFEGVIKQNVPGPGYYSKVDNDEKRAKFAINQGYKWGRSEREGIIKKSKIQIPGPGSYSSFSQFIH